jgi:hypothetical protein
VVLTFTLKDTQFEDVQYLKFDSLKEGLKDAPGMHKNLNPMVWTLIIMQTKFSNTQ